LIVSIGFWGGGLFVRGLRTGIRDGGQSVRL
jgi:hypothetical protein